MTDRLAGEFGAPLGTGFRADDGVNRLTVATSLCAGLTVIGVSSGTWPGRSLALPAPQASAVRTFRDAVELVADSHRLGVPLLPAGTTLPRAGQHWPTPNRFLETSGGFWIEGASIDHPLIDARVF